MAPGCYLEYNLASHQKKLHRWYNLKNEVKREDISPSDAVQKVRELLTDSVSLRSRADVKLGSCLSGGVDSSAIVTVMKNERLAAAGFTTVTSVYEDKNCNEEEYSDAVTRQTGFSAVKVYPNLNDMLERKWDEMIYHFDQPFSSASHFSEYHVFKTARENGLTVMLDGQGADEYMCGYWEYFYTYVRELVYKGKYRKAFTNLRSKASLNKIKLASQLYHFLTYVFQPVSKTFSNIFRKNGSSWLNQDYNKNGQLFSSKNIFDLSVNQVMYSSLRYQLHSQDRTSMQFSVESRTPYLDHRLVEFILGLPSDYKINNGSAKQLLLKAVPELPESVRKRTNKLCFPAPGMKWMKENKRSMRKLLQEAIDHTGMFTPKLIRMFDEFCEEDKLIHDESIFFRVISFYKFCKIFKIKLRSGSLLLIPVISHVLDADSQALFA